MKQGRRRAVAAVAAAAVAVSGVVVGQVVDAGPVEIREGHKASFSYDYACATWITNSSTHSGGFQNGTYVDTTACGVLADLNADGIYDEAYIEVDRSDCDYTVFIVDQDRQRVDCETTSIEDNVPISAINVNVNGRTASFSGNIFGCAVNVSLTPYYGTQPGYRELERRPQLAAPSLSGINKVRFTHSYLEFDRTEPSRATGSVCGFPDVAGTTITAHTGNYAGGNAYTEVEVNP